MVSSIATKEGQMETIGRLDTRFVSIFFSCPIMSRVFATLKKLSGPVCHET